MTHNDEPQFSSALAFLPDPNHRELTPVEDCETHRFLEHWSGGVRCLHCNSLKCAEPGCQNVAGPDDLCGECEELEAA